ncbi:phosphate ABC transporter, inner membrane subunit PstA [Chthoniobacter flavus Ellin428]|uniref:Phosphate transport system permease protein PstA n=1 Tax=Chthoniobacter flavus Ellin428 TaxID=497964 RepID=B4CY91_9BACT|nr:phosphate ABC transporter permease PstA [Chthoniobacter flavus]EDY21239.1 phosphate ABC transporter, inner membrane subunit PstA [Chthoniobacter flavus Ellin428]TCO87607.1 phosphate ABC transporter membrane protein 2 (PhoT family) [Chthoniobacter flavus]
MNAPVNPFVARKSSARTIEHIAFGFFRTATYFILICAAVIFGFIFVKGGQTVFRSSFPFVNVPFLTQAPETLYVFQFEGKKMELGDRDFRKFKEERHIKDIPAESYVYSSGGIFPCIVGTVLLVIGSMAIALFIGISSAIYLNEYSKQGRFVHFVRLAILNLAGVPSIVFGLFGFALFVMFMPMLQDFRNPTVLSFPVGFGHYLNFSGWNVCLLSGWFTLAFMALPVVITASEESLKSVPKGFREGSLALGATKWQTIRTNVLPYALPGMLTSSILGIARVAGETAPIMFTAAYVIRDKMPWQVDHPMDFFFQGVMALPYHIYVVSSKIPQNEYTERVQYGAAFVFLVIVMGIALTSILLRIKMRNRYRW